MTVTARLFFLLGILSLSNLVHAQDADAAAEAADAAAEAATDKLPPYVWTAAAVTLQRWPGVEGSSAAVEAGRRVEVILQDGDQVRVRSGTDFGWLPLAQVSATEPAQE
jgi:hypothetical protein